MSTRTARPVYASPPSNWFPTPTRAPMNGAIPGAIAAATSAPFAYAGFVPGAPGTCGSLAALSLREAQVLTERARRDVGAHAARDADVTGRQRARGMEQRRPHRRIRTRPRTAPSSATC